jgi:FkbM family methyltransferase
MLKNNKFILIITTLLIVIVGYYYQDIKTIYKNIEITSGCPKTKFQGNSDLHSQLYEDYILSYIFKDKTSGLFVDVGTNYPDQSNSTHYFSIRGWKGINIEPNKKLFQLITKSRPNDINLNLAVSNEKGKASFYIVTDANEVSSLDSSVQDLFKDKNVVVEEVEVDTLTNIFDNNKIGVNDIDFIKIDVENKEKEVLEGLDLKKFRPKVLVLETVSPSNFYSHVSFEDMIIEQGYLFGMTDDLNRYYYRKESPEFKLLFKKINKCTRIDKLRRNVECFSKHKCSF